MTVPLIHQPPLPVAIGGTPLGRPLSQSLALVLVRQALAAPSVAELEFSNPPSREIEAIRREQPVRVAAPEGETLFEGEIVSLVHDHDGANGHRVRARAYDPLQ